MGEPTQPRRILTALAKSHDKAWVSRDQVLRQDPAIIRTVVGVWLTQLETEGFVRSRSIGLDKQCCNYQITSRGRAALLRDDL